MTTTVVNIKSGERWDVCIGRACPRARDVRCHRGSWLENPYKVAQPGQGGLFRGRGRESRVANRESGKITRDPWLCATVEEALEKYERRLRAMLAGKDGDVFRGRLLALDGQRLGCWCHPDPCHGHVVVKLIDELKRTQRPQRDAEQRGGAA